MYESGSDNHSGVHPKVLAALENCNSGYQVAYGNDDMTAEAEKRLKSIFGPSSHCFLVLTGTGANVLSIKASCASFHSVICTDIAHLYCDESGAPENFVGCKVVPVPHEEGKLTVEGVRAQLTRRGDIHSSQPRLISITQSTELGTIYSVSEIKALSTFAKENGMYLHMDGARLSNAAATLSVSGLKSPQTVGSIS